MRSWRIGILEGDGIGPEIIPVAAQVMDRALRAAAGGTIGWSSLLMGWAAIEAYNDPIPKVTQEALADLDGWLMGPHNASAYPEWWQQRPGRRSPAGELRDRFELYANIRPCRTYQGVPSVVTQADLMILRENTEGFLSDRNMYRGSGEFMPTPGVAMCVGVFRQDAVERIIRRGFELAARRHRRVTVAHKAGPLPLTLGMYKRVVYDVAADFPHVEAGDIHVDALTAALVREPERFDVIVAENLLGDILSDLAGELTGSLGLAPSINAGDRHAMAAAAHGSAPDIAGRGIANPIGAVLAGAQLLGWLSDRHRAPAAAEAQRAIESAVRDALASGIGTPDVGGTASTRDVLEGLLDRIAA